jgi:hypothetical protein
VILLSYLTEANAFNLPLASNIAIRQQFNLLKLRIVPPPEPCTLLVMMRQITNAAQFISVQLIIITEIIPAAFIKLHHPGKRGLAPVYTETTRAGAMFTGGDAEDHNTFSFTYAAQPPAHAHRATANKVITHLNHSLFGSSASLYAFPEE